MCSGNADEIGDFLIGFGFEYGLHSFSIAAICGPSTGSFHHMPVAAATVAAAMGSSLV